MSRAYGSPAMFLPFRKGDYISGPFTAALLYRFESELIRAGAKPSRSTISVSNLEDDEFFGWDGNGAVDHWMIPDTFVDEDKRPGRHLSGDQLREAFHYLDRNPETSTRSTDLDFLPLRQGDHIKGPFSKRLIDCFTNSLAKAGAKRQPGGGPPSDFFDEEDMYGWDMYGTVDNWYHESRFEGKDYRPGRLLQHWQLEAMFKAEADAVHKKETFMPDAPFITAPIHDKALVRALSGFSYPIPNYDHFAKGWPYSTGEIMAAHKWVSEVAAKTSTVTVSREPHPQVEALNTLSNLPSRIRREINSLRALKVGGWSGSTLNPDMGLIERTNLKDNLEHAISNLSVALNHAEYAMKAWEEMPKGRFVIAPDGPAPKVDLTDDSAMLDEAVESVLSTSDALFG